MSESPIELRGKGGGVVFQGTQSPGGGSSPLDVIRVPIAFNTPDLLLTGVQIATLAVGDVILSSTYISVTTAWDGTTPTLLLGESGGAAEYGANLINNPDTSNGDLAAPVLTGGNFQNAPTAPTPIVVTSATPLVATVNDGNGGDPGSAQGAGEIVLMIVRAP